MKAWMWAANVCGWPAIQLGFAWFLLRRPAAHYAADSWLTRQRHWERDGNIYRKLFRIDRWRRSLPSGAVWLKAPQERHLTIPRRTDAARFIRETRRAEYAHWYMLLCTPVFFLWNPPWACGVMAAYGILTNLPCILVQRSNRLRAKRALKLI